MLDFKYLLETGIAIATTTGGLILGWMGTNKVIKKYKREWAKETIKEDIGTDRRVHEHLNDLRYEADSCRAKLFQYHNGTSFANGVSMKKMSMTHESCHPGMQPTFKGNNDQMLSLFVDMLEILERDSPELITVSTMKDSYFKSYLQSNHVLMISMLPVRNIDGVQVGCILCEWCGWTFADRVQEEHFKEKFQQTRNSIEYILSIEKKMRRKR
jgi:hypothetical protein